MEYHRLLDYRPLDRLERMSDEDRAALLHEVLRGGPSEHAWRAVYELFALWPDNDAKRRALELANRELASWDDRLRAADTSSTALVNGSTLSSLARIVRSISIYRRADSARSELLAVVTAEEASSLTRLSITRGEIGRRGWQAMIESPYLEHLQHLHVANTVMGGEVFQSLVAQARLPGLRCLKLTDVSVGLEDLRATAQLRPVFNLQALDLSRNVLGDEGAQSLARTPWLQSVERLTLRHNFIRDAGIRTLLSSPFTRRIAQLDVSDNDVSAFERTALIRLAGEHGVQVLV